jgi:hypothetical protein
MPTMLVLGDSDHHVIGVVQRPDEDYTQAREEALQTAGVAFTAIVEFADVKAIRPEDALVEDDQVTRAPVGPTQPAVSSVLADLQLERRKVEEKLADPGLTEQDLLTALLRREKLRHLRP